MSQREEYNVQPDSGRPFLSRYRFIRFPDLSAQLIFWPVMLVGLALDLWSKSALFDWLGQKQGDTLSIIDGVLHFVLVQNAGAAFGIALGQRYLLITVSVLALMIILAVFLLGQAKQTVTVFALGLLAAGVCGNLYDRIFNDGLVRDFIDIVYWPDKHWPAFNIADTMLCIGVGLLIVSAVFTEKSSRRRVQQRK